MTYQVRFIIGRDYPEVMAIENHSFAFPWSQDEMLNCLRMNRVKGKVVDDGKRILGYVVYEVMAGERTILNIAVHPDHRRQGIGRAMIGKVCHANDGQRSLRVMVRERNLDGQLFFRDCGFRAERVLRGQFDDTDEDAFLFRLAGHREEMIAS